MENVLKLVIRHNLIIVMLFSLALPITFASVTAIFGPHSIPKIFRPDTNLVGVTESERKSDFKWIHIKSHDTQKYVEQRLTDRLPLRSFFIRINNQIYYSLFQKSYSEYGVLIVGKSHQLISQNYITSYCGQVQNYRDELPQLIVWANKLKVLSDYFKNQGKTFVYVITPSKAEYMPEVIPDRFHCRNEGISWRVKEMVHLLEERNVLYANEPEVMVAATQKYGVPMFPQGGIHWNQLGSIEGANAIITALNKGDHFYLRPFSFDYSMTNKPDMQSRDLLDLLNLMHPNARYLVPKVDLKKTVFYDKPKKVVLIGGSFCAILANTFSLIFPDMTLYSYLKMYEMDYKHGSATMIPEVDLNAAIKRIASADLIILEENSEILHSNHGQLFFETLNNYADNQVSKRLAQEFPDKQKSNSG